MEQQTQWQVAGSAPESYERYLVPAIFGPFATDLVELSAIRPGERVLHVALRLGCCRAPCCRGLSARPARSRGGPKRGDVGGGAHAALS